MNRRISRDENVEIKKKRGIRRITRRNIKKHLKKDKTKKLGRIYISLNPNFAERNSCDGATGRRIYFLGCSVAQKGAA
jgi:hypothetical protein